MISHVTEVRDVRTFVNPMDSVRNFCDDAYMMKEEGVGRILLSLKQRAGEGKPRGLTLEEIARDAGFSGKSSVQVYFSEDQRRPLKRDVAEKLVKALAGKGSPPITAEEVLALAETSMESNASAPFRYEGASLVRMNRDLPIYGSAIGAERLVEGEAVELTTLNRAEVIEYRERPPILNGKRDVYGLFVQGSSMDPAFDDGDLLVAQRTSQIQSGDFVVVYLRPRDESDDGETAVNVLVKRLIRRNSQYVELKQYQPELSFRISSSDILRVDKALRMKDILS